MPYYVYKIIIIIIIIIIIVIICSYLKIPSTFYHSNYIINLSSNNLILISLSFYIHSNSLSKILNPKIPLVRNDNVCFAQRVVPPNAVTTEILNLLICKSLTSIIRNLHKKKPFTYIYLSFYF